jgi:hypothetical protein
MKSDTLRRFAADYTRFRALFAGPGVDIAELDEAAVRLGVPLPADYREFVLRYGGGHAGSLPVAGIRRWKAAGNVEWSIIELTEHFRAQRWPGTESWAVFSIDGCGNPIGLDSDGRVWLSDHDCRECVCLEASSEDWLRRWALHIEPHRESGYLAQQSWFQRSQ